MGGARLEVSMTNKSSVHSDDLYKTGLRLDRNATEQKCRSMQSIATATATTTMVYDIIMKIVGGFNGKY